MKLVNIVFCLTLLGGIATSCIGEDMDECLSTNKLILSYKGDGTTEIFPDKINRVEMFVFDAENNCVHSSILPDEDVRSRTTTLPPLVSGDYRIICIGNTYQTNISATASGDYSKMLFAAEDYVAGKTVSGNDSLYYASISYTVEPFDPKAEDKTQIIPFASSHYDLSVEVYGVPEGASPSLDITGVSPGTDFENRACGTATQYIFATTHEPAKHLLKARNNIMRHKDHENVNVNFRLSQGDEPLATVNLAAFLAANPIIDCSKHEVLIPIQIEFKSGKVTISVPEWYIKSVTPVF
ncbi:MAG: FimB/Mfa2 family fimbrial subunit [Dysgonamonadaceae bacterium]|jgi:hypothetical protein|nr:FimB/Mfa2 family fimbrial subunit [Dysgonamonadaceae bacterium]